MDLFVLGIIQARIDPAPFPGKVLATIVDGKGSLELMVERVLQAKSVSKLVVATTTRRVDDPIAQMSERVGVNCFRGDESNVLDRYFRAMREFGPADAIVRMTGACPLLDPSIIDKAVNEFRQSGKDYVSNLNPPTFPEGMEVEVFSFAALTRVWALAESPSELEHVGPYVGRRPDLFTTGNVTHTPDLSKYRLGLGHPEDFPLVKAVFEHFYQSNRQFDLKSIVSFLDEHPDILGDLPSASKRPQQGKPTESDMGQ